MNVKEVAELRQLKKYNEAFGNPNYDEIFSMGQEIFQILTALPKNDIAYPHFKNQLDILRDYIHLLNKSECLNRHEHQTLMTVMAEVFTKEGEDLIEEKVWISRSKTLKEASSEMKDFIYQIRPSVCNVGEIVLDGPLEKDKDFRF